MNISQTVACDACGRAPRASRGVLGDTLAHRGRRGGPAAAWCNGHAAWALAAPLRANHDGAAPGLGCPGWMSSSSGRPAARGIGPRLRPCLSSLLLHSCKLQAQLAMARALAPLPAPRPAHTFCSTLRAPPQDLRMPHEKGTGAAGGTAIASAAQRRGDSNPLRCAALAGRCGLQTASQPVPASASAAARAARAAHGRAEGARARC
eukprot:360618-Chlamydomonas_euryale.AAC.6